MAQLWRVLWLKTAEALQHITALRSVLSTAGNTRQSQSGGGNVGANIQKTYWKGLSPV